MPTVEVPQLQFIVGGCGHAVWQQRQVCTVQSEQVAAGDSAHGRVGAVMKGFFAAGSCIFSDSP